MMQTTETAIKIAKDGRAITYRAAAILLAGEYESSVTGLIPLTATERAKVGPTYTHRAGRILLTTADVAAITAADAEYKGTVATERARPEVVERDRIAQMYAQAKSVTDEDYSRALYLRSAADAALAAWRIRYQDAAREEQRLVLHDKAEHERELATGALTYDADGWLTYEDQQHRHDEHMAKAANYDRQANEL